MDRRFTKTVIRKPDIDTCLAALIMGVDGESSIKTAPDGASDSELRDRKILCIEAGGSGLFQWNNLDHHHSEVYYPPACVQAQRLIQQISPELQRLVEYVSMIDECRPINPPVLFPSLSSIFSGMLLLTPDKKAAFVEGIRLLKVVVGKKLDPFQSMPLLEEWQSYTEVKKRNGLLLYKDMADVFHTCGKNGTSIAYLKTRAMGGSAALYKQGLALILLHNPAFGDPPENKYTIASQKIKVAGLLDRLNSLEQGWGGRSSIIGSPTGGSRLSPEKILGLIVESF